MPGAWFPLIEATSWSLIHRAARQDEVARQAFVERYYGAVRAYLAARWQGNALRQRIDDATHDVFVECLRGDGVLERLENLEKRSFRAFLFGTVRNVARRQEHEWNQKTDIVDQSRVAAEPVDQESLSLVFERAWARSLARESLEQIDGKISGLGTGQFTRNELLKLRFCEGQPIRKIAQQWDVPAERLHRELSKARREFALRLENNLRLHIGDRSNDPDFLVDRLQELLRE